MGQDWTEPDADDTGLAWSQGYAGAADASHDAAAYSPAADAGTAYGAQPGYAAEGFDPSAYAGGAMAATAYEGVVHMPGEHIEVDPDKLDNVIAHALEIAMRRIDGCADKVKDEVDSFWKTNYSKIDAMHAPEPSELIGLFKIVIAVGATLCPVEGLALEAAKEFAKEVANAWVDHVQAAQNAAGAANIDDAKEKLKNTLTQLSEGAKAGATAVAAHLKHSGGEQLKGELEDAARRLSERPKASEAHVLADAIGLVEPENYTHALWVRESLEEDFAAAYVRYTSDTSTPFWRGIEQDKEEGARIDVEREYERKGWSPGGEPDPTAQARAEALRELQHAAIQEHDLDQEDEQPLPPTPMAL